VCVREVKGFRHLYILARWSFYTKRRYQGRSYATVWGVRGASIGNLNRHRVAPQEFTVVARLHSSAQTLIGKGTKLSHNSMVTTQFRFCFHAETHYSTMLCSTVIEQEQELRRHYCITRNCPVPARDRCQTSQHRCKRVLRLFHPLFILFVAITSRRRLTVNNTVL
jgi:hypothetical protein